MKTKEINEKNIEKDYKDFIFNLLANQKTNALFTQMDKLKKKICEIKDKNENTSNR